MNSRGADHPDAPVWYEIRLQGRLDQRWSAWLADMDVTPGTDGTTLARGPVVDQAALHGLLARLCGIGLPLLSIVRVDPAPSPKSTDPDQPSGD